MRKGLGFFLLVCLSSGCAPVGVARHVLQVPDGGVIAMPSNAEWHRAKAHDVMTARFPQGYVVEKEEEVVVGQTTTHNTRTDTESMDLLGTKKKPVGSLDTTHTTRTVNTQDQTEYRIHYRVRQTEVDTRGLRPTGVVPEASGPVVPAGGRD